MNIKIAVAILLIGLITEGHSQLYCYVCENCPDGNDLSDDFLVLCGEETTATSPPTSATEQSVTPAPIDDTTAATSANPEISTSESTISTEQSTEPSTQASTEPATEPPTETSTQNTSPSMAPTTEQSSTISTISTMTPPQSPITTTAAIPAAESTLTTSSEIITVSAPATPPTTTDRPTETPIPNLRQNAVKQLGYNCYVIANGTRHVNRGCVVASPDFNDMCRKANENVEPVECQVCGTDKCNSSSRLLLSVFLLFFSIGTILSL